MYNHQSENLPAKPCRYQEELLVQTTKHLELEQHRATEQKEPSQGSDRAAAELEVKVTSSSRFRLGSHVGLLLEVFFFLIFHFQQQAQEKYDRAVMKISRMKEEHKALKETIDAQSQEVAKWVESAL